MSYLWHIFLNWSGASNAAGVPYAWWSGFGSDLGEIAIVGVLLNHYRSHKCATCWRLGRHEVDGTHYRTCHKHLTASEHAVLKVRHQIRHPEQHAMLNPSEGGTLT